MSRRKIEPFVSLDKIRMYAMALVVHESQHRLGERISSNGSLAIKIESRLVGLRHTETVLVHEAEQAESPGISMHRERRQFLFSARIVTAIERHCAPFECIRARRCAEDAGS